MTFDGSKFVSISNEAYEPDGIVTGDAQPLGTALHHRMRSNSDRIEALYDRCGVHFLMDSEGAEPGGRPFTNTASNNYGDQEESINFYATPLQMTGDVEEITVRVSARTRRLVSTEGATVRLTGRIIGPGGLVVTGTSLTDDPGEAFLRFGRSAFVNARGFAELGEGDEIILLVGVDQCSYTMDDSVTGLLSQTVQTIGPDMILDSNYPFVDRGTDDDQPTWSSLGSGGPNQHDVTSVMAALSQANGAQRNAILSHFSDEEHAHLYSLETEGVQDRNVVWNSFVQIHAVNISVKYRSRSPQSTEMKARIPEKAEVLRRHKNALLSQASRKKLVAIGRGGTYNDGPSADRWPLNYRQISTSVDTKQVWAEILSESIPSVKDIAKLELSCLFMPVFSDDGGLGQPPVFMRPLNAETVGEIQEQFLECSWVGRFIVSQLTNSSVPDELVSVEQGIGTIAHFSEWANPTVAPFFQQELYRRTEGHASTKNRYTYREGCLTLKDPEFLIRKTFSVDGLSELATNRPLDIALELNGEVEDGEEASECRLVLVGFSVYAERTL